MKTQLIAAVTCAFAFAAGSVHAQSGVVTLYSADGLHDLVRIQSHICALAYPLLERDKAHEAAAQA